MKRAIRRDQLTSRLNLLWIGLGLFMFGYAQPDIILFSPAAGFLSRITQLGGIIVYAAIISALKPSANEYAPTAKYFIYALLGWQVFMFLNGDWWDLLNYTYYFDPYCYTIYLYALLFLIPTLPLMRSFFTVSRWLMLCGLPIGILLISSFASYGAIQFAFEGFIFGAAMIVMTSKYHSRKWLYAAFGILLFGLLVAAIKARRNLMLTDLFYLASGGYMVFFKTKGFSRTTKIFAILSLISVGLLGAGFFIMNSSGMFASLVARAGENTREYVFLYYFWDMLQTPIDMIIGRGMRGAYECAGVVDAGLENLRQNVENGYLQLMLKGGVIYIIMYLTLFVMAIHRGWKSQNQFCKTAIIILLVQIFDMLFFGLHAVNLKTFMIWMCASACLSGNISQMTDEELLDELSEKKLLLPKWDAPKTMDQ